ncbi:cobalamin biosynthesis protein CobD [Peptoanaerobacter stomatis]|uniref:Cobalamin biosynthesis protein CobD n=1 Tax=Peptoanaerobacter stomatis TaxID=796937 RepID=G9XCA5_9FIRM|nr:adenosylcobinamide-phosphate synthase CbiB [Peptoanaerobacter stomatis]EHL19402.1 cobalamin biosynthesis protein CobD [Peptoanaerobacter stomatis]
MYFKYSIFMAYLLDLIFADPYNMPHPVKIIGKLISFLEDIFLKTHISKFISGIFTAVITISISYIATYYLINLSYGVNFYLGAVFECVLAYTVFASKCLEKEAIKIYEEIKKNDLNSSRIKLSYIVGRDTKELSFSDIIRATIETVAENTVDAVITPIFFMIIGGVPLAMAFKAVSTLDSMIGYRNEKYEQFGKFSARLDDICNFIPARISVIIFTLSAYINSLDWKNCIKIGLRDRKNHLSPNCAYPEGLIAGALGIQLGGAHHYKGKLVEKATIGDDLRDPDKEDILKSVKMLRVSTVICVITAFKF